MALQPVSFRWDPKLVERIDRARGDVPRSVWVRRQVERALDSQPRFVPPSTHNALVEAARASEQASGEVAGSRASPAPAEEPSKPLPHYNEGDTLPVAKSQTFPSRADAFRRASSLAKRDVQPIPKKG